MQSDSIQDSTRYVISDTHHGSVLPGTRMEMWRDVYLLSGANVVGGVWCGSLTVSGGGVRVAESVYSHGPVAIQGEAEGTASPDSSTDRVSAPVTFGSCITTPDSILVGDVPFKVRVFSDIFTKQLNLSNAFVYGNIFADPRPLFKTRSFSEAFSARATPGSSGAWCQHSTWVTPR